MNTSDNIVHLESNRGESCGNGCQHCMRRPLCLANFVEDGRLSEFEGFIQHSRPIQRGHSLVSAGDPFDRLYFVRSGTFKSYRLQKNGALHMTGFYLPGEMIGLDDMHAAKNSDYVESLETGSVCQLSMSAIEKLMVAYPTLITQLLGTTSAENRRKKDMMYLLGNMDADQKLASFLLDFSARSHRSGFSADSIQLTMTRGDIANYLGMAVETVSRVLQRLRDQGVLLINYRTLGILDRKGLEMIVAGGVASASKVSAA